MRAPLKTALASWAPSINIINIIIIITRPFMTKILMLIKIFFRDNKGLQLLTIILRRTLHI